MPTGYTADVASGKIKTFQEYALLCARAFGACIMMRDEPLSSEIPEFKPDDYHSKKQQDAKAELELFRSLNEDQLRGMWAKETRDRYAQAEKAIAENQVQESRYRQMLDQAYAFKSPSPDHDGYAKFLITQLEESIKFDCGGSYWENRMKEVSFEEWKATKQNNLTRDIAYHASENLKEIERTHTRNEWVKKLKMALGVTK